MSKNPKYREGKMTKAIEEQSAKIESSIFLYAALGSMGISLALKLLKKEHGSLFVGQWASSFLLLGIYNKIVKIQGNDTEDEE